MRVVSYLQDVYTELRKVAWPTTPQVIRNVVAVLVGVALAVVVVGVFDFVFLKLLGLIIK